MANPLVECIPNFSEARRPEVVQQILDAITAVPGVHVLDHHSDLDHNRTVVTYVGVPQAVEEAAFQAIALAGKLINLDEHRGEHPRLGATDVVPFVPLRDLTMQECVEMARRLAKRVADSLEIPVYLYEEAATSTVRQNLENIRRGEYEAIKAEIGTVPERKPDFGPSRLGTAGAVVIGARAPLVAYNVYLTTDDLSIAQKIAKAMRHSSGGFRFVKALGLIVEGRAQVSMNLTNFHQTPIFRVVEAIRREAARYGVSIHHSELVGLIPQNALIDSATWYLQLDGFKGEQILETRLYESMDQPAGTPEASQDIITALAAATPTPGGGSASAYAGAMGAALVCMVARLTTGKKKYADVEQQMWELISQAESLQQGLQMDVAADAAAFDDLMKAVKLPKETPEQQAARDQAVRLATLQAARVPLAVCNKSCQVMSLAITAANLGNLNAISDAGSGFSLARAAFTGAGMNVQINLLGMADDPEAKQLLAELESLRAKVQPLEQDLSRVMLTRGGIKF
jgi:glutamate formiminotransferase/formiminotetrahydrofolate cyclodeaminase